VSPIITVRARSCPVRGTVRAASPGAASRTFRPRSGRVEQARQLRLVEHAVQAHAPLAGRDREQVAHVAQFREQFAHAGKQLDALVVQQVVVAVAFGEPRIVGRIEARRGDLQRIAQAEADHVAGRLVGRRGQAEIAARGLDAVRDVRSRIHQRAVPVEDDQIKLLSGHASHAVSRRALS
jgi:S-adenosylmethionine:diacylglycerol 3-amino-3-carboxypropyl transferase